MDKQPIGRLIGVLEYFKKCEQCESGYNDFWFKNTKSIAALRKRDRSDVYRMDRIIDEVNDAMEKNSDFNRLVRNEIKKIKDESIKIPEESI